MVISGGFGVIRCLVRSSGGMRNVVVVHAMMDGSRLRTVDWSVVGNLANLSAVSRYSESLGGDGMNIDSLVSESGLIESGRSLELDGQVVLNGSPVVEWAVRERTQQVPRRD
jgi:hypothetical protein